MTNVCDGAGGVAFGVRPVSRRAATPAGQRNKAGMHPGANLGAHGDVGRLGNRRFAATARPDDPVASCLPLSASESTRAQNGARRPQIAVVVPSHDRPLRLRWLLNALERQTLPRGDWELVVAHDSNGPETEELLRTHPLALDGTLRHVWLAAGSAPPGRNRNAAWRLARAPIVAFTDDDCRPPADWLQRALAAARQNPGAIVQGATCPDPDETVIGRYAPWVKTQSIWPPRPWAQACNIVYTREALERHGGFDESLYTGEDTDLAERAQAAGIPYVGARDVVTYHAVDEMSLWRAVGGARRWHQLPLLVKRHPRLRQEFPGGMFYRRSHAWLPLFVAAWFLERRSRLFAVLAVPYVVHATPYKHGPLPRGRIRSLLELPGHFAIDTAEFLTLAWGSIRHRSPFL